MKEFKVFPIFYYNKMFPEYFGKPSSYKNLNSSQSIYIIPSVNSIKTINSIEILNNTNSGYMKMINDNLVCKIS